MGSLTGDTSFRDTAEGTTKPLGGGQPRASREDWVPSAGSIISERYRVGDVIGAGGMGAVVRAERIVLREPVAIKFLHPKLCVDPESKERFLREAMATSRIKNEHVVRIIDVGSTDAGLPYMVMDLLEGRDLGDVIASGRLSVSDAVDYVLQVCEALADAHSAGIVHRDLKPSNLWLTQRSDGSPLVKVLDFGISKLTEVEGGASKLTETNAVFGSPTYMSPEQIRSSKKVNARTDVWSMGVVLFELLTLKLPFEAESMAGALAAISADPPTLLRAERPDAPAELEHAIGMSLEKDVSRRASLAEWAGLLRPFASPAGIASADRVVGRGGPARVSMRPPAPSSAHAFSVTERTLSSHTTQDIGASRRRAIVKVAMGVIAAAIVAATVLTVALRRPSAPTSEESRVPGSATASATIDTAQPPAPAAPTATSAATAATAGAEAAAVASVGGSSSPTSPKRPPRPGRPKPQAAAAATATPAPEARPTATPAPAQTSDTSK